MVQSVSEFQIEPAQFGVFDEDPVVEDSAEDASDEMFEQAPEGGPGLVALTRWNRGPFCSGV